MEMARTVARVASEARVARHWERAWLEQMETTAMEATEGLPATVEPAGAAVMGRAG